jgi:hypothetical protein
MAVVETIKIDGDTSDFVQEVNKANKAVENLNESVDEFGADSSKAFSKVAKNADKTTKEVSKSEAKVKSLAGSLKTLAIGALAVDKIGEAFLSSQKAVDFLNTSLNRVTGLLGVVFKALSGDITSFDGLVKAIVGVNVAAGQLVELEKAANAAEVERQRIQLQGQKNAEVERQKRDDINRNLTEREKANNRLNSILKEQISDEQAQVKIQLEYLDLKRQLQPTQENELAYQSKSIELLDIQERILGQQSEFQANILGLQQERLDITNQQTELDGVSLERTGQLFDNFKSNAETVLNDVDVATRLSARDRLRIEAKYYEDAYKLRRKSIDSQIAELERQGKTETALYAQLLTQRQDLDNAYLDFKKDNTEEGNQLDLDAFLQSLDLAQQAFLAFSDLYAALATNEEEDAERAFKVNKALQLANAIVNTASGIVSAYSNPVDVASGIAFAKSAVIAATGTAQIATIAKTRFVPDSETTQQSEFSTSSQPANFNIVSKSGNNILMESIASQFQKPMKAYVVSGEVISGTQLDRRRIRTATFG